MAGLAALPQLAVPVAGSADGTVACGLAGTASFSPGGPGASSTFGWTLRAPLRCTSDPSGTPTGGVLTVGENLTESVPITLADGTVVQGTAQYATNPGQGWQTVNGLNGCGSSEYFIPDAFFSWSDGTVSEATLSAISVAGLVEFDGSVATGAVLSEVPGTEQPPGTAPSTYVVNSDNPNIGVFDNYDGVAVVTDASPADCTTAVTQAALTGVVEFGQGMNVPKP